MAKVTKDMLIGQLITLDPHRFLWEQVCTALAARLHRWNLWKKLLWFMEWMLMYWFSRSMTFLENNIQPFFNEKDWRRCQSFCCIAYWGGAGGASSDFLVHCINQSCVSCCNAFSEISSPCSLRCASPAIENGLLLPYSERMLQTLLNSSGE